MSSSKPLQPNNTHHHHNPHPTSAAQNGGAGECFGGSPPSPSPAPSLHRKFRRSLLVRSKSRRDASIAGALLRQCLRWFLLLVPLLYFFVVITCARPFPSIILDLLHPPAPGSVYRSLQIFDKLRDDICSDNSTPIELSSVWKYRRRRLRDQKPCIPPKITNTIGQHLSSIPSRFLIVEVNGGLNQQRSAICNAVAVAGILNATLVIPRFEFHSIWMDKSTFGDIYDEDHFIATLGDYVRVVRELPEALMESYDYNISNIPNFRVMAWSSADYYLEEVYPVLQMHGIVRIAPFANRLAMFAPPHIQFLRCLANYEALKFSNPISTLAEKLVNRMIEKSSRTGGKYVSVHLRFEEDMVAFSCCVYDGSEAERSEMDLIRERGWRGKFKRKDQVIRPGLNRISGKCPLTPVEVGMMLRGMGFDNTTSIYLASGKIYKAEQHLAPLLKMFPLLYTKESLATTDELAIFEGYSSRLAALDYTVCLFSEVFMTTQGGNFPQFLMGHRRFLHGGHAKTIKPDKHKLVLLLQDMGISWRNFKDQMEAMLIESDLEGAIIPRKRKSRNKISLYAYPFPECKCLWESKNSTLLNHNNIHMHDQKKNVLR